MLADLEPALSDLDDAMNLFARRLHPPVSGVVDSVARMPQPFILLCRRGPVLEGARQWDRDMP